MHDYDTEETRNALRQVIKETDKRRQKLFDAYWDDMYARIKTIGETWVNEQNHNCSDEPDLSKRRYTIEQSSLGISLTVWTGTSHLIDCDGDQSTIKAFGTFREHDIKGRWLRISLWFEFLRRPFCIEYGCDEIDFPFITQERYLFDIDHLEQVYDKLEHTKAYLVEVRNAQDFWNLQEQEQDNEYQWQANQQNLLREGFWENIYRHVKAIGEAWTNEPEHNCSFFPQISQNRYKLHLNEASEIGITLWYGTSQYIRSHDTKLDPAGKFFTHDIKGAHIYLSIGFGGSDDHDFRVALSARDFDMGELRLTPGWYEFTFKQGEELFSLLEQIKRQVTPQHES